MSVMKADCVVFPVSPCNSMEAVAHLVKNVSARYVLVGKDPAMQAIMKGALDVLRLSADHSVFLSSVSFPSFEDLFTGLPSTQVPDSRGKLDDVVMYIQSSGSTAHPKAIPFNNRRIIQLSLIPYFSDQDLTDKMIMSVSLLLRRIEGRPRPALITRPRLASRSQPSHTSFSANHPYSGFYNTECSED